MDAYVAEMQRRLVSSEANRVKKGIPARGLKGGEGTRQQHQPHLQTASQNVRGQVLYTIKIGGPTWTRTRRGGEIALATKANRLLTFSAEGERAG